MRDSTLQETCQRQALPKGGQDRRPYAFAEEVSGVDGRLVSRYLGIVKLPDQANVVEMGEEESHDDQLSEREQVQQKLLRSRLPHLAQLVRHSRRARL